jgi:hypothetical protein
MAFSDDNITFSEWVDIDNIKARYLKFKIECSGSVILNNVEINITGNAITRSINDLDTSTLIDDNGLILPVSGFEYITQINVAMQGTGSGASWEVVSKDPAKPKIKLYKNNVKINAIIDVEIKGL